MKLLVTGGSGFIGSALIRLAIKKGYQIVNLDSLTYAGSNSNLNMVKDNSSYFFENVDIRDRAKLNDIFLKHKPDSVIHLAAESHVDKSIESPNNFIDTNINGTFNLLEASRFFLKSNKKFNKFRFLHVSTDEVYGSLSDDINIRFTEETPYNPRSPYSASKAGSDHLVKAWYKTYNLPTLITNCSNNYGPYHYPEKLVPLIIINSICHRPLPIYGNGKNIRDWIYVDDHVEALLLVLEKGTVGRSYNIGSEKEVTNLDLVLKICKILDNLQPRDIGSYSDLITFVADRPGHDFRYSINPERIINELGWVPQTKFEIGLENTVRWYLDNEVWWKEILNAKK